MPRVFCVVFIRRHFVCHPILFMRVFDLKFAFIFFFAAKHSMKLTTFVYLVFEWAFFIIDQISISLFSNREYFIFYIIIVIITEIDITRCMLRIQIRI